MFSLPNFSQRTWKILRARQLPYKHLLSRTCTWYIEDNLLFSMHNFYASSYLFALIYALFCMRSNLCALFNALFSMRSYLSALFIRSFLCALFSCALIYARFVMRYFPCPLFHALSSTRSFPCALFYLCALFYVVINIRINTGIAFHSL